VNESHGEKLPPSKKRGEYRRQERFIA
jgi:hypothetical protein